MVLTFTVLGRGRGAPIDIGMDRAQVYELLGRPQFVRDAGTMKSLPTPDDDDSVAPRRRRPAQATVEMFTDAGNEVDSVQVSFDAAGAVDWVGVSRGVWIRRSFLVGGHESHDLLAMPYYAACECLAALDPTVESKEPTISCTSWVLGVSVYSALAIGQPLQPAEEISYFRDGYYDKKRTDYKAFPGPQLVLLELAALCYELGIQCTADAAKAEQLLRRAAARGSALGRARCAEQGWGRPVDAGEAVRLYREAINVGDTSAIALHRLARCYEHGFGVLADADRARALDDEANFDDLKQLLNNP